ncbi:glycosyltransferase family 4 protein [Massilia sp. PAMC28688]|uniref:glycosyltransferase family 4 protein n=1 Tax=Massilia sp. PAMC28688 TaxID=2861283 RepID=UPI001C62FC20|nr:glycosyltransferase family 4 protein [Massilia sp. PAMC28688]QYF92961.1 glycosyltransferase family 4 protein [Massilia sp. PAMC28688]
MRIGILSYPMLFQREAAIQLQIRETTRALNALHEHRGIALQVEMVDPHPMHLEDYDLIHVFSASGGNYRIVEAAAELGVPVVLSPLISPGWDRACGEHARLADHRLGRQTAWSVQSSYAQTRRALQLASTVVALGQSEKRAIEEGFLIDGAKVRVFPNGVSPHLFDANGELFRQRTGIQGPFVLMAGHISPYQNQLGMARVLAEMALPFVLLGETRERDQDYLRQVRAVRGVTCLGGLKHDAKMLASACAGASVLVLPCQGDACSRTVFDSLAAGTPVIMNTASPVELPESGFALRQVAWDDAAAQQHALRQLIDAPPAREQVRALVRPYTWERAAAQLASCYVDLAASRSTLHA